MSARNSRTFALCCCIAVISACSSSKQSSDTTQTARPIVETQGFAEVYLRQREQTFSVSATVTLPQKPNVSWYSSWLMVVAFSDGVAPFVEVGLMRRPNTGNVLTPFVSTNLPDVTAATYREFKTLKIASDAAPHRVSALVDEQSIVLSFDGKQIERLPRATFFPKKYDRLYEQIGSQVSTYGDTVAGSVSDISIRTPDGVPIATEPTCGSQNAGLTLARDGKSYSASGSFRKTSEPPPVKFVKLPSMEISETC